MAAWGAEGEPRVHSGGVHVVKQLAGCCGCTVQAGDHELVVEGVFWVRWTKGTMGSVVLPPGHVAYEVCGPEPCGSQTALIYTFCFNYQIEHNMF